MLLRWDEPLRPLSRVPSGLRFFCLRVSEDLIPFGARTTSRLSRVSLACHCNFTFPSVASLASPPDRLPEHVSNLSARFATVKANRRAPRHVLHHSHCASDAVSRIRAVHAPIRTGTKRRSCSISAHAPPLIPPRLISSSLPHRRFRTGFQGLSASLACRERLPSLHAPRRNPQRCSVTARTGTINAFPHTRSLHLGNSDRPRPTGTLKTDSQERGRRAGSRRRSNLP